MKRSIGTRDNLRVVFILIKRKLEAPVAPRTHEKQLWVYEVFEDEKPAHVLLFSLGLLKTPPPCLDLVKGLFVRLINKKKAPPSSHPRIICHLRPH